MRVRDSKTAARAWSSIVWQVSRWVAKVWGWRQEGQLNGQVRISRSSVACTTAGLGDGGCAAETEVGTPPLGTGALGGCVGVGVGCGGADDAREAVVHTSCKSSAKYQSSLRVISVVCGSKTVELCQHRLDQNTWHRLIVWCKRFHLLASLCIDKSQWPCTHMWITVAALQGRLSSRCFMKPHLLSSPCTAITCCLHSDGNGNLACLQNTSTQPFLRPVASL